MPEIQQRLEETSAICIKAYAEWRQDEKKSGARETLQEAVHELRKVASRLEIELAVSERDQNGSKKLAIPPHRSARKKNSGEAENAATLDGDGAASEKPKPRARRPRKAASGE